MIPNVMRWEPAGRPSGATPQTKGTLEDRTCWQPNRELKLEHLKPDAKTVQSKRRCDLRRLPDDVSARRSRSPDAFSTLVKSMELKPL